MDLIWILIGIALIGLAAYALIHYVPMPHPFPAIIVVVAVVFIILWLLRMVPGHMPNVIR